MYHVWFNNVRAAWLQVHQRFAGEVVKVGVTNLQTKRARQRRVTSRSNDGLALGKEKEQRNVAATGFNNEKSETLPKQI